MKFIFYFKLLFIVIILNSCLLDNNSVSEDKAVPPIKLQITIDNKSDVSVGFSLKGVYIGADGLENIEQIFSDDSFWTFERFKESCNINGGIEEQNLSSCWDSQYKKQDNWDRVKLEGTVDSEGEDKIVCYYNESGHSLRSILLRLSFKNGEERILAGWPKYYYSKLENVAEYGFFYKFSNYDKKIREFRDNGGNGFMFSINTDDSSGEITGYNQLTVYSLKLTINSVDDIKLEVDKEETGKTFEVIRDELPEGMS